MASTRDLQHRAAGVLLHVTSLPGGRLGRPAYRFIDWLEAAGQRWWQILPLGPPNRLGSPYEASSAFAIWPELLASPRARVTRSHEIDFMDRHSSWIGTWTRFAGPGAVADQVRAEREWAAARAYAHDRGIRILGDMPLYVAARGAETRAHPELFVTEEVAGVPPDYFSDEGQLWGSPLYAWPAMRADGFRWWIDRVRRSLDLADALRIDHFRGLVAYWAVPRSARTARAGRWRRAPGAELLSALQRALGEVPLIAEDLGVITPAVDRLRQRFGLPGMAVLQFMIGRRTAQQSPLWPQVDRIVYTGTHDNPTARQWLAGLAAYEREALGASLRQAGIAERPSPWAFVRLAYAAPAMLAIIPAQDLLGLGASARMNTPARRAGNWRWQLRPGQLTADLAARVRDAATAAGRVDGAIPSGDRGRPGDAVAAPRPRPAPAARRGPVRS